MLNPVTHRISAMIAKEELKRRVLDAIDARADEIIDVGEAIWRSPELGFKEFKTAELVERKYEEMGWSYKNKIALRVAKPT